MTVQVVICVNVHDKTACFLSMTGLGLRVREENIE